MIEMHILDNVIAWLFLSFIVGVFAVQILQRTSLYGQLGAMYVFSKSKHYERLGILWFRYLMVKSPLRIFNQAIKLTGNHDLETLLKLRVQMINSELGHWVGLLSMLIVTVVAWGSRGHVVGAGFLIANVFGNLYPSLLQQYNKRRLGRLIEALEMRKSRSVSDEG